MDQIHHDVISKTDFNAAVHAAILSIKPKLLAAEAAVTALDFDVASMALTALHQALAELLTQADEMGSVGTFHTDTGGTDKGDGAT